MISCPGLLDPKRCQRMSSQDDTHSAAIAAIERDDAETLRMLIGSSPHVGNDELGGWLVIASFLGKPATLEMLLRLDADANWQNEEGETPFSYACAYNQYESARILYEHGADINIVHPSGCTPLDIAVCQAEPAFREWLKAIGAIRNQAYDEWPWPPSAAE